MATSYLEHELRGGYIHNWLVAGPWEVPVEGAEDGNEPRRKLAVAQAYYEPEHGIAEAPEDRASFDFRGADLKWRYVRCYEDHFVDLSSFHHTWTYLRAWAYTQVRLFEDVEARFVLTTNGPADVWINGQHVHRQEHFHHQDPQRVGFEARLREGDNEILVRFEEVAAREVPYVMALQIIGVEDEDMEVRVPMPIERSMRHMMYEKAFEQACLETDANYRGKVINLHWAEDLDTMCHYQYLVQDARNRIHIEGTVETGAGAVNDVGHGFRIWEGPFRVVLRAPVQEQYEHGIKYQRELPIFILDTKVSTEPYGTYEERHQEALNYAAERKDNLYAEIAKMALGKWADVDSSVVLKAIDRINTRGDCSDFDMVGLLGVMIRYLDDPAFPEALKEPLRACVLGFKYWHDEPGRDAMCYTTENHSILFHTSEILAGQLYPDEIFSNVGQPGRWHQEKGEQLALAWLHQRGATGFWEWDSNCYFEEDVLALSHLAGLAENEDIAELAAVILDKLLFTMAVNSYKGVFGSTHGRSYAPMVKSGQLEPTSGIGRLMWGMGVFNPSIRGLVGMATSEYGFPELLAKIATDLPEEMWDRERHIISANGDEVNKVTYKTPDYMLCSAQDFRPGDKGYQQHIWQATFGPDTQVFVTHPVCISENGAHRPGFWTGNYVLPRVAQWKDVLIAVHKLPEDDWMGFTHAYFPAFTFDAYTLRDGWAFARKGEGYLALTASTGLQLTTRGPGAYRELRSYGRETVWVLQMGRSALDGSFETFQEKVLGLATGFSGLDVRFTSLRGDTFEFGWSAPFMRNGELQSLAGFKHYENPYCVVDLSAPEMDIEWEGNLMRLAF